MSGIVLQVRIGHLVANGGVAEAVSAEAVGERIGSALAARIASPAAAVSRTPDLGGAIASAIFERVRTQLPRASEGGADGSR
jgi:hypothetical protein